MCVRCPVAGLGMLIIALAATACGRPKTSPPQPMLPAAPSETSIGAEAPALGSAKRDVDPDAAGAQDCGPDVDQDAHAADDSPRPSRIVPEDSTQLIVVTTKSWNEASGAIQRYERRSPREQWLKLAPSWDVVLGRNGMGWGLGLHGTMQDGNPTKAEGDLRSPAGVYELGEARGFGQAPPEGTTWPYVRSGHDYHCIEQPYSDDYNTFIRVASPVATSSPTLHRRETVLNLAVVVRHNSTPVVRSAGSCILLHIWANASTPTQGCTAMQAEHLRQLVAWLSPSAHPVFVQLPETAAAQVAKAWGLPGLPEQ